MSKKRAGRGTLSTPISVGSTVNSEPSADRVPAKPSVPAIGNKTNKWLVLASVLMLLATTGGLLLLNLTYHTMPKYIGEIRIESQEEYHAFLDVIFVPFVTVRVLDIQPVGVDLPVVREQLSADYPKLPAVLGFSLSAEQNPLAGLNKARLYDSRIVGREYGKIIWTAIISMIGYPLAIGLWMSRNGIYEKPKPTKSTKTPGRKAG